MNCCEFCFDDFYIKKFIIQNNETGPCNFCNSQHGQIIYTDLLSSIFLPICDLYQEDSEGRYLWNQLNDDWKVFSKQTNKDELLKKILGEESQIDLALPYQFLSQSLKEKSKKYHENWDEFTRQIKWDNRFQIDLHDGDINSQNWMVNSFLALETTLDKTIQLYRARLNNKPEFYPVDNMGAPPKEKVGNGRANPVGIPYLYLASSCDTAISEVRPALGQYICVGNFTIHDSLRLVNLVNISPFQFHQFNCEELLPQVSFFRKLSDELSKPILPSNSNIDYLPTQFLSEMIKRGGWDGIQFKSCQSSNEDNESINVILFDPNNAICGEVNLFQTTNIKHDYVTC
ncbi:MAG: RES family NAD+ phosphorylase [Pseudomonadota bacterium]